MFTHFYSVDYIRHDNENIDSGSVLIANTRQMSPDEIKDWIRGYRNFPGGTTLTLPKCQAIDEQTFVAMGGDARNPATKTEQ